MGWFKNSFGIGAGVTLGDMAAQTGVAMAVDIIDGSTKKLQDDYRIEHFDPIVRDDISHIIARGALSEMSYPFPTELDSNAKAAQQPGERKNFVQRHKIAVGIAGALVLVAICNQAECYRIAYWAVVVDCCRRYHHIQKSEPHRLRHDGWCTECTKTAAYQGWPAVLAYSRIRAPGPSSS